MSGIDGTERLSQGSSGVSPYHRVLDFSEVDFTVGEDGLVLVGDQIQADRDTKDAA